MLFDSVACIKEKPAQTIENRADSQIPQLEYINDPTVDSFRKYSDLFKEIITLNNYVVFEVNQKLIK